jgi:hypothetical protein
MEAEYNFHHQMQNLFVTRQTAQHQVVLRAMTMNHALPMAMTLAPLEVSGLQMSILQFSKALIT